MKASGPLLFLLVAFWAVVLLPMWVRRHQDALAERSAEDFTRAMRVLARRSEAEEAAAESVPHVSDPSPEREQALAELSGPRRSSPAVRARRARVLGVLVALLVLSGFAAAVTPASAIVALVPGLLLTTYVVALRRSAVREASRRRPSAPRLSRPDVIDLRDDPAPAPPSTLLFDAEEPVRPQGTVDLRDDRGARWEPRETPLPTYVRKNALHRRRITLGTSEAWTASPAEAEPSPPAVVPPPVLPAVEAETEQRRAVND